MLVFYPQVPTGHELGIGCAVSSYDGQILFGIISDTVAAPNARPNESGNDAGED